MAPARDGGHADRCRGGCCTGGVNEQRVLRRSQAVDRRKSLRSNTLSGTQRAAQALEGQRQRCPPQVPKPVNWRVWSAAATELRRRGKVWQATLELVAVEAYLHLSEARCLTTRSLLAPTKGGVTHWMIGLFPETPTDRQLTG